MSLTKAKMPNLRDEHLAKETAKEVTPVTEAVEIKRSKSGAKKKKK